MSLHSRILSRRCFCFPFVRACQGSPLVSRLLWTSTSHRCQIQHIQVDVKDGVRRISFNRPDKKNALTPDMFKRVFIGVSEGNDDDATVVIALTGIGEYFTSGMDMTRPKQINQDQDTNPKPKITPEERKKRFATFLSCFVECKKPLIALVNGPTVGVGVTMLGLFDAVYASDSATFHTNFTRFALPPEMASTYTFPRIMGYAKASNLLMFNQKMNADEAYNSGLVSRVIPQKQFVKETDVLLQSYGQLPVKSLIYSKELVRGRWRDRIYEVSKKEQSYFDPETARKVIMGFMTKRAQHKD